VRRRKNNPALLGDPGVGKTAIAEGLAQRIVAGTVPRSLRGKRLLSLQVRARWVTLRARWVTLRARWVTLRARWVTLRARWGTLRARWVTLRARWVTLRASWVTLTNRG
jgi:hypothetical protein